VLRIIERRIRERLPVAYLTNEAWLGEYRFYVDQRVIVPRSFIAELLREQLAPWIDDPDAVADVLDLCTGSAAWRSSRRTLSRQPASTPSTSHPTRSPWPPQRRDYDLAARIRLVEGNLFAGLKSRRYDLIIANPPYVNAAAMATLPAEYRREPELALASGDDGLDLTRAILAGARSISGPTACWSSRSATTARHSKPLSRRHPSPGSTPRRRSVCLPAARDELP
jgi:ribosomal protein L3 glutamine methyltransferase